MVDIKLLVHRNMREGEKQTRSGRDNKASQSSHWLNYAGFRC
jgi:hypothetical protein